MPAQRSTGPRTCAGTPTAAAARSGPPNWMPSGWMTFWSSLSSTSPAASSSKERTGKWMRRPPEMMDVFPPTSFQMRCPRHRLPRPRASSRRKERGLSTWLRTKERQQVTTAILLVQMTGTGCRPSTTISCLT